MDRLLVIFYCFVETSKNAFWSIETRISHANESCSMIDTHIVSLHAMQCIHITRSKNIHSFKCNEHSSVAIKFDLVKLSPARDLTVLIIGRILSTSKPNPFNSLKLYYICCVEWHIKIIKFYGLKTVFLWNKIKIHTRTRTECALADVCFALELQLISLRMESEMRV